MKSLTIDIDEFEHDGRLYGGQLFIRYTKLSRWDSFFEWEPELLRLVDITDGDKDWEDDDVRMTVLHTDPIAQSIYNDLDQYIVECCSDDCRFD